MPRKKRPQAIAALSAEMNLPHIAASALRAMHHLAPHSRKLDFIDAFHGYACNRCGCRFPESRPPKSRTPAGARRAAKLLREKQFAAHICSSRST